MADRLDVAAVARAAGSFVARTLAGVGLGLLLGVAVFAVERAAGWLGGGALGWLMLPLYALGAAALLGFIFGLGAVRRAATALLVDSGALRRMIERGLDRVRQADQPETDPPPRGWLGGKVHALGRTIAARLRSTAAPEAETPAQIDQAARMMIDEWNEIPAYLAWAALAVLFVVPPLLL